MSLWNENFYVVKQARNAWRAFKAMLEIEKIMVGLSET